MYPHRIKSAILDGVGDSFDYMAGGWTTNLQDTDLTFVKLADYCFGGGPHHCAFWDKDGPAVIADNIGKTITDFRENPIGVPGNSTHGPEVVTYNDFKRLILEIVYNPLREFPMTAQILHELSQSDGTTLAEWKRKNRAATGEPLSDQCKKDGPYSPSCFKDSRIWDAMYGVTCSDALSLTDRTKEEYRKYVDSIKAQSRLIGEAWASILLPCTAWHARPHWRYDGNFRNKTANPILFAGNTIDPVTPLRNAFKMATGFEGAGVLHNDAEGHCTYASISMCTGRALREYFQTGKLPGEKGSLDDYDGYGALCEPSRQPFDGYDKDSAPPLPEGESDKELWEALVALNQVWP